MAEWYQQYLIDTGRSAMVWALLAFVVTYVVTRTITVRIRARAKSADTNDGTVNDGAVKDVVIGGVHIHHQVWGILLLLVTGLLDLRFRPEAPWQEILAVFFGAGAALALDEFALWLHLDDVYWSDEGRKSIDAVMIAGVVGVCLLVGTSPIGADVSGNGAAELAGASVVIVVHIGYTTICLLKGKIATGLIGLPVPLVSLAGAIRLAKPDSFWARRFYSGAKVVRAENRFGPRHQRRQERLRDIVSRGGWG